MDLVVFVIILSSGFGITRVFKRQLDAKSYRQLKWLWLYHIIFGIYYCFFILGDAKGYWGNAGSLTNNTFWQDIIESKGTAFVTAINYFPASILDLSYFSGTMIYTLIGYSGIAMFYTITFRIVPQNSTYVGFLLFPLLFFWPNLHFWSVAVGKDTLTFFSIALFFYGMVKRKYLISVFGLFLCYLVRPHITIMLLAAFGSVSLLSSGIPIFRKAVLSSLFIAASFYILPVVLEYVKASEFSVDEFQSISDNKVSLLSRAHTGSSIDISSYPLPLKIFTFIYRPLFFDINGIPALVASIENFFLLLLSFKLMRSQPIKAFRAAPLAIKGLFVFLIIGTLLFSSSLGNLGIMIRMRNMFLPGLLIFILWTFSYHQSKKLTH